MALTKFNLQQYIDEVVYDYASETLTFYTNINGYLIPLSIVHTNKELYAPISTNLNTLDSLGISRNTIWEGVERCKRMHGYS